MIAEVMRALIRDYIEPLLRFSGVFVDSNGFICPEGDPSMYYKVGDKELKIVSNDTEFDEARKNDSLEVFSPFTNPRHMTFVANVVRERLIDIHKYENDTEESEEEFDEENETVEDEADIREEFADDFIGIFRYDLEDGRFRLAFVCPSRQSIVYGEGTHLETRYAMWIMCADAYNKHSRIANPFFADPQTTAEAIIAAVENWIESRKKINKVEGLDIEDFSSEWDESQIAEFSDSDYIDDDEVESYVDDQCEMVDEESGECLDDEVGYVDETSDVEFDTQRDDENYKAYRDKRDKIDDINFA